MSVQTYPPGYSLGFAADGARKPTCSQNDSQWRTSARPTVATVLKVRDTLTALSMSKSISIRVTACISKIPASLRACAERPPDARADAQSRSRNSETETIGTLSSTATSPYTSFQVAGRGAMIWRACSSLPYVTISRSAAAATSIGTQGHNTSYHASSAHDNVQHELSCERTSLLAGTQPRRWHARTQAGMSSAVFQLPVRESPLSWVTRTTVVRRPRSSAARRKSCSATHLLSVYPMLTATSGSTSSDSRAATKGG